MKLQLHLGRSGKPKFEGEKEPTREHQPRLHHHGLRGWLERKARSIKESWAHADHGVAGKTRQFWDWLQQKMPADESTLIRLRTTTDIEIYYPVEMESETAHTHWTAYLNRCGRRHMVWACVNGLFSPVSLLLAPLPGPNLIGYWFAYRAVRDVLAWLGVRHARKVQVTTTFHPSEVHETIAPAGSLATGQGPWRPGPGKVEVECTILDVVTP